MANIFTTMSIATLLGVGVAAAFAPETLARNYGLPLAEGDAAGRGFVRALGARDATLGAVALAFALDDEREAVRRILGLTTFLAASDFAIVATTRGFAAWPNLAIHGSGIVGLLLAAITD